MSYLIFICKFICGLIKR